MSKLPKKISPVNTAKAIFKDIYYSGRVYYIGKVSDTVGSNFIYH